MTIAVKQLREAKFRETMVLLPLRQYEALMEYLEDMEDRLSVRERMNDENIPWKKIKEEIRNKRSKK